MRVAEVLARIGQQLGGEVDEARIIQTVLDGGCEITGAETARFFARDSAEPDLTADSASSRAMAPVISRSGEALGLLVFEHTAPDAFSPREQALATALASQLAIALENGRLVSALQRQRARAEEASRDYRFLAESVPQLVWRADASGRVDYVNERWAVYTGRPGESLLGDGWLESVHPDDRDRTTDAWHRAVAGEATFDATFRLQRGDGAVRWYLGRAYALSSETRRVLRWFGTCTDISRQQNGVDHYDLGVERIPDHA